MGPAHEIARQSILDADRASHQITVGEWARGIWRALGLLGTFVLLGISAAHWFNTCSGGF
jgi:hypothetical protein